MGRPRSRLNATHIELAALPLFVLIDQLDRLASDQNVKVRPIMTRLDEVLCRSVFGKRPDGLDYTWNPLWQMSEAEKAEIAGKKAQAFMVERRGSSVVRCRPTSPATFPYRGTRAR